MVCGIGNTTKERVLDSFQANQLVGPMRTDGSFFVMKVDEFDRENKRLSDEILATHNIANSFWTREGNTARFSDTFAELVDIIDSRKGTTTVPPWVNIPTEAEVVTDPILRRLNRAFLGIKATIFENAQQLMDKAREIGEQTPLSDLRFAIIGEKGAARLKSAETVLENLAVAKEMSLSKSPKEIKMATGWEKGIDGLWRYEVQYATLSDKLKERVKGGRLDTYTYPGESVNAPDIAAAYPNLWETLDIHLVIDLNETPSGKYEPGEDRSAQDLFDIQPSVEVRARSVEEAESILVHEIQHAIQKIEGFAQGGTARAYYRSDFETLMRREAEAESALSNAPDEVSREEARKALREITYELVDLRRSAHFKYQRLAGEVEARNAEERAKMTDSAKRQVLLADTEDVYREDQEVLLGALGVQGFEDAPYIRYGNPGAEPIGKRNDRDELARQRFDLSKFQQIGKGSDRTVFDIGDGMVMKVAHTARGMEQNIYEGDWGLVGIIPRILERGINYVVMENVPRAKSKDAVTTYDPVTDEETGTSTFGQMISELSKFSARDFDNRIGPLQDALAKYGFRDILNYDVLWLDFVAPRNWGWQDGTAYHIDGGTFGGERMIREFMGNTPLSDPEFRKIYEDSKKLKKQFGDTDKNTMFSFAGMEVWHGSPHKFDKFSMDKIGTGTGEDAYGWGLYFTTEEEIARGYAINDYVLEKYLAKNLGIVPNRFYQIPEVIRNSGKSQVLSYIEQQVKGWSGVNNNQVSEWRKLADALKGVESNLYKAIIGEGKADYVVAPVVNKDSKFNVYSADVWDQIQVLPRSSKDGVLDNQEYPAVEQFDTKEENKSVEWLEWFGRSTETQRAKILDKLEEVFSDSRNLKIGLHTIVLRDRYDVTKTKDGYEVRVITNDIPAVKFSDMNAAERYKNRQNILDTHLTGKEIYQALAKASSPKDASTYLSGMGFMGNKVAITGPKGEKFNYVLFNEGDVSVKDVIQFHQNEAGEILGFAHGGKIYLNGEKITADTTLEEAGHIWLNWSKENRPDLFKAGIEKVRNSPYLASVKANKNYTKEALRHGAKGSTEYNLYLEEEALAKAIADEGAKFVSEAKRNSFKEWVMEMWKEIAKAFGIKNLSPDQIKSLTLGEFAKKVAADMFNREVVLKEETTPVASNGKPSNLTPEQHRYVRTKEFKDWFGDWELSPEDASQMVDKNGEPKIFFHGTNKEFEVFDKQTFASGTDAGWLGEGFYFYGVKDQAQQYGKVGEYFLNIRDVYFATSEQNIMLADKNDRRASKRFSEMVRSEGSDGVFYNGNLREEVVVFEPSQIIRVPTSEIIDSPGLPPITIPENWENPC